MPIYLIKENVFPNETTWLMKGKKVKNSLNLMAAMCLNGSITTREAAKFVLSNTRGYEYKPPRDVDSKKLDHAFNRLLTGREKKRIASGKLEKYPGLLKEEYVIKVGTQRNEKNQIVTKYFLSLKGCLFALGFRFDDKELKTFIEKAARYYLYFAYLNTVLKKISFSFLKQIFIKPIQSIIKSGRIVLDDKYWFSFTIIADLCGYELHKWRKDSLINYSKKLFHQQKKPKKQTSSDKKRLSREISWNSYDDKDLNQMQTLINNTWYDETDKENWEEKIIQVLYTDQDYELDYSDHFDDTNFLFVTMRAIHVAYYSTEGIIPPLKHKQKLPYIVKR